MRHESEPSVEEILESIKKVIAQDNRDLASAQRTRRERDGLANGGNAGDSRTDNNAGEDESVLELGTEAELVEARMEGDHAKSEQPLITEEASASMRESLTALAMLAEPGAAPKIVRSGETSLEGMVREMLRPMLAEWLDQNMPALVEKLVAAEIARIAGKKN